MKNAGCYGLESLNLPELLMRKGKNEIAAEEGEAVVPASGKIHFYYF
jgi:hypothetical protein